MILTEYLLNTGRRPQTSERAIKYLHNQEGQKQKEGEKDQNGTCAPGRELYKRKGSSTLWSPFTRKEIHWDREGTSSEENAEPVCSRQNRERPVQMVSASAVHSPAWDTHLLVQEATGNWSPGFRGPIWGEDQGWLCRNSLKGLDSGATAANCVCRESLNPPYWWYVPLLRACEGRGGTCHSSLFPCTHIPRQQDPGYMCCRSRHQSACERQELAWATDSLTSSRGTSKLPQSSGRGH